MMMIMKFVSYFLAVFISLGCKKNITTGGSATHVNSSGDTTITITTDKAVYNPGDVIHLSIDQSLPSSAKIRYRQLSTVIAEANVSANSWTWTAPSTDFTG